MSNEDKKPTTKTYATLVRGRVYYLGDALFEKGMPKEVTPTQRMHLEDNAVDTVTVEGQPEGRQKFKFEEREPSEVKAEIAEKEKEIKVRQRRRNAD